MAKIVLNDVGNLTGNPTSAEQTLNTNSERIETEFDNTLSRDGSEPNHMEAVIDMNSNRIINLGAPAAPNDAARFKDIANVVTVDDLVVPPLDGNETKYLGTDGVDLVFKEFVADSNEAYWSQTAQETAASVVATNFAYPPLNVLRYGAVNTGLSTDAATNSTAFSSLFRYLQKYGGRGIVPEGIYYLGSPVTLDGADGSLANTNYANIEIFGYGAILNNTSVNASATFRIEDNFTPRVISICGFTFNHEFNSTINQAIRLLRASCVHIKDCTFRAINTNAGYTAINMVASTPGNGDTHGFWNRIENCVFRPLSGGNESTWPRSAVRLAGQANDTHMIGCSVSGFTYGIELLNDGIGNVLANNVVVERNAFEGMVSSIRIVASPGDTMYQGQGGYWPTGLRVLNNRFEDVRQSGVSMECTVLNPTTPPLNHAFPPHFENNWSAGNVPTWIYNPYNAYYTNLNPSHYGDMTDQRETIGGSKTFITGWAQNRNIIIKNQGETSEYHSGHLVLGNQHLWYSTPQGAWMTKTGNPTSDTDGTILGGSGTGGSAGSVSGTGICAIQNDFQSPGIGDYMSYNYTKVGDIVCLRLGEELALTSNGTRFVILIDMTQYGLKPASLKRFYPMINVNGVMQQGLMEIDPGTNWIYLYGNITGAYFPNGATNCGIFGGQSFTYSVA